MVPRGNKYQRADQLFRTSFVFPLVPRSSCRHWAGCPAAAGGLRRATGPRDSAGLGQHRSQVGRCIDSQGGVGVVAGVPGHDTVRAASRCRFMKHSIFEVLEQSTARLVDDSARDRCDIKDIQQGLDCSPGFDTRLTRGFALMLNEVPFGQVGDGGDCGCAQQAGQPPGHNLIEQRCRQMDMRFPGLQNVEDDIGIKENLQRYFSSR